MEMPPFGNIRFQHPIALQRPEEEQGPLNCKRITYYDKGLADVQNAGYEGYPYLHETTAFLLAGLEGRLAAEHRPIFNSMFTGYSEYVDLAWALDGNKLIEAEDPVLTWESDAGRYYQRGVSHRMSETLLPEAVVKKGGCLLSELPVELVMPWFGRSEPELPPEIQAMRVTFPEGRDWQPVVIGRTTREDFMSPPPDYKSRYHLGASLLPYNGVPRGVRRVV